jgi:hypothetical protein
VRHSIEWQDDPVNAAPEERATVADLRLFINELNVTQHLLDGEVGDHVTVALYSLAHGLAHDWWTIFGGRDREISLTRYRSGYLLPDIRLNFDGAAFEVSAHQCVYENPDLRFWGGTSEIMSRKDGEAWLSSLIEEILARLVAEGISDTSAALRWARVQSSRRSGESSFCEAAGGLGLDPYQIDDAAADFIEKAEGLFSREALVEFVSGAGNVDKSRLLDWVERMTRATGFRYHLANLRPIVDATAKDAPSGTDNRAWARGYRRARVMRRQLGLKQHHRFESFKDLAKTFGASQSYNLAPKVDGIHALRRERADGIHIHLRNHGDSPEANATHLFAMARAIGDAACFPEPEISPINSLQSAVRQAAGRAFAAEFLAPIDEIQSMLRDKHDVFSIADAFAVSRRVIERQIENGERIGQVCG